MFIGNQSSIQIATGGYGQKTWALSYVPENYDAAKKYCLLFHFHGVGEVGSTEDDLKKLINTGLPQLIAQGLKPAARDKNGALREWIVISPQAPSWSYGAAQMPFMLIDAMNRYSIDTNYIFTAGLSAGGQGAWTCALDDKVAGAIAGTIPLSAAQVDPANLVSIVKKNNLAVWAICGTNDSYGFYPVNVNYVKMLTDAGLPARMTGILNAGHDAGAWNTPWLFSFDTHPNNQYKQTLWQWMLDNPKNKVMPTVTLPTVPCQIQAEEFTAMSGISTENTLDTGGGKNVGWIDDNDWLEYKINVPTAGPHTIDFRVANIGKNAKLEVRNDKGETLTSLGLPITGGYQSWQTVTSRILNLPQGDQTLRLYAVGGGWNINWLKIQLASQVDPTPVPEPTPAPTPVPTDPLSNPQFASEISAAINKYSVDEQLSIADYKLADYVVSALKALSVAKK